MNHSPPPSPSSSSLAPTHSIVHESELQNLQQDVLETTYFTPSSPSNPIDTLQDGVYDMAEDEIIQDDYVEPMIPKQEIIQIHIQLPWKVKQGYLEQESPCLHFLKKHLIQSIHIQNVNINVRFYEGSLYERSRQEESDDVHYDQLHVEEEEELEEENQKHAQSCALELTTTHINIQFETFHNHLQNLVHRIRFSIQEIEILDHLRSSAWTKFMTFVIPEPHQRPRTTDSQMIKLEMAFYKNLCSLEELERRIKVFLI